MEASDAEMEELAVLGCTRCPALVESRTQIVNGVGPSDADLLIIGEAPGVDEDRQGEPFVGRSGEILTEKLAEAGVTRESVRITNSIRCRPPENRDPRSRELDNCLDWLDREIATVDPTAILAVGKVPAEHLLGRRVAVTNEAGRVEGARLGGRERPVVICVHPAAMLYDRSQERSLTSAIAVVARRLGIAPPENDQSRLEDF